MDPAAALEKLAAIEAAGVYWEDAEFSLPAPAEGRERKLRRVAGEAERTSIFPANYVKELHDVKQGEVNDCFLMVAMAALPLERIKKLFLSSELTVTGAYAVQFCHEGKWRAVVVNDQVWHTAKGKPSYCSTAKDGVLWPMLLEKAYAKFYNSYRAVEAGNLTEAWYDLTGLPSVRQRGPDTMPDSGAAPTRFQICGSVPITKNNSGWTKEGLRTKHAYVVERVVGSSPLIYRVWDPHQTAKDCMEKVKGPYRYGSAKWTAALKAAAGLDEERDPERGYFFLSQAEYENGFQSYTSAVLPDVPHEECVEVALGPGRDGGNSMHYTFRENHIFQVVWEGASADKSLPIWVTTNQAEQRGGGAAGADNAFNYKMCGCTLIQTTPEKAGAKEVKVSPAAFVAGRYQQVGAPMFVMQRTYSEMYSLNSRDHYLVVSTDDPGVHLPLHLTFQAAQPFALRRVTLMDGWEPASAVGAWAPGGGQDFVARAPQFVLQAVEGEEGDVVVHVVLRQLSSKLATPTSPREAVRTKGKHNISILAYKNHTGVPPGTDTGMRISPAKVQFANYAEVSLALSVARAELPVTLLAAAAKAEDAGNFELHVYASRRVTLEPVKTPARRASAPAGAAPGGVRRVSKAASKPGGKKGGSKPASGGAPRKTGAKPAGALGVMKGVADMYGALE
eukprot:TRINITY_DN2387_c0_g1_i2.p1 TRINITY_DN2387_c0_g1~~TRINITY_DN2387_c0_g1_i2.p1  ORF type:complete len:706 (+),score=228.96 TRINITY_DN2387_c0_g1_i2:96-2120(+)